MPRCLWGFVRFPDKAGTLFKAFKWVAVSKCFWIAAKHYIHVIQLAVYLNTLMRNSEELIRRRTFFFRAVLRVGHYEEPILKLTKVVICGVARGNNTPKVANNCAEIFTSGNHTQPPIEWNRTAMAPSGNRDGVSFEITA